jgi:hypothetical protein
LVPIVCLSYSFDIWLIITRFPDASVQLSVIEEDIKAIKDAGAGGIELLSFYNYGLGPAVTDWSRYGFGTPAFQAVFSAALNASAVHGVKLDFALGPNQGQGVPSATETTGLAYELIYGSSIVPAGKNFSGPIPMANPHFNYESLISFMNKPEQWGENKLVSVVAAEILNTSRQTTVLSEASLVDLTTMAISGKLDWVPPNTSQAWALFAFYERYTNQRASVSVDHETTALGNGSWIVDHFSSAGAKKMTDFWDENVIKTQEIRDLLKQAAQYCK